MRTEHRADLNARLDRLGEEWAAAGAAEDEAARMRIQNDIFCTLYDLYPTRGDAINTVFMQDWRRFDPAKGTLSSFFSVRLTLREKDAGHRNRGERQVSETDPETGKKTARWVPRLVQEPPAPGEDGQALSGLQREWNAGRSTLNGTPEDAANLDAAACILLSSILRLPELLEGRENNPVRRRYFQMFFTDAMADYLHREPVPGSFLQKERELFQALRLSFLDYFMAERCRTAPAIQAAPLKPYGELVDGRPMEEAELPLQDDVYSAYLDRVEHYRAGVTAISSQRQAYLAFLRRCLF